MNAIGDKPLSQGINYRLLGFLAIVAMPFVALAYGYINHAMNGGIVQHKDFAAVDLKSLGFFQFDANSGTIDDVPRKWRNLDGKRVQLEGYPFANNSASPGLTDFEFVFNIQICCFGGPPKIQERVFVKMPPGKSLHYRYGDMARLTGVLHVDVKRDREAGVLQSIYTLDFEHAEPM